MNTILHTLVILPIAGFLISLLIPRNKETLLSQVAFLTVGLHLALSIGFVIYWMYNGHPILNQKDMALFETGSYQFFLDFSFDKIAATYLLVGAFLTFLVTVYSRYYMHREAGYKRFFNTMLFFYFGYVIVILSGNLETMFVGWEMLGISSFLLIAFYRDRYLPVKNAVKVFSIYRIGDVGLILTMWLTHHLFHENITFVKLNNYQLVHEHLATHSWVGVLISLMILITAAAKSAQLPFSSWLPRAMEGPTPSSAIFYGSLAVHVGVFLLLRTFPFWEQQLSVRILIGLVGLVTTVITTGIARVQSSIKAQIAYASSAQIGLIFIEVAAGFENLALFHFAGNAFLRTYQLLVSPSVVSYLIREQFYNFVPRLRSVEDSFPKKLRYSLYILCLKEWNIDSFMYRYLWNPMKWLGRRLDFLTLQRAFVFFIPMYLLGLWSLYREDLIPASIHESLPLVFSIIALIAVLKSFTERRQARLSWTLVIMNHFWIALAISFNEHFGIEETILYLSGIVAAGILGFIVLRRLKGVEGNIDLDQFHGHSYRHPKLAFVFLVACLAATGFPITPTFVGEDLIFTHIHEDQALLAFFVSLSFIIDGLAIIRIYARVFLGPHVKSVYEMAYRSS
ncbi:MAG TPA: proton-conducting transporter membrane subunit [Cyclobacteriaceae bacterium]|nr:proton-conducting transporter membrane subunit [Cyclobacteriaceae bacterium]